MPLYVDCSGNWHVWHDSLGKTAKAASKTMPHLDETGMKVAGCRHGIAQKAINMFCGEM